MELGGVREHTAFQFLMISFAFLFYHSNLLPIFCFTLRYLNIQKSEMEFALTTQPSK